MVRPRVSSSAALSITKTDEVLENGGDEHLYLLSYCRGLASRFEPGDIVLIGGLSRSGKTTFADDLRLAVLERGGNAWTLSLDRWLRDVDRRLPGVMGRYDLSVMQEVTDRHTLGSNSPLKLELPEYQKLEQRAFFKGDSILIHPEDVLIIEGTIALTLGWNCDRVHRFFVDIDEFIRKQRVIREYLSRGRSQVEAEAIYAERQIDETPIVLRSSANAIHVNIVDIFQKVQRV